jgi:hypothetical protein
VDGIYYTVVAIGEEAFMNSSIEGINLNKVNTISDSAFENCIELKEVDFGDATTIGDHAFLGCATLATINLRNVNVIGDAAFYGVPLSKISIDEHNSIFRLEGTESNGYIQRRNDLYIITPVCGTYGGIACGEISTTRPGVGDYAFYGCNITKFNDAYLNTVGDYAFSDCYSLHVLYLGAVTGIGTNAFAHCPISQVDLQTISSYK